MRSLLVRPLVAVLYVVAGNCSRQGRDTGARRRPNYTQATKMLLLGFIESVCIPHPNDYRNPQLILLVGIKPTAFQNYGRMNGSGVAAGIKWMVEKLWFLSFAINSHDYPIQGQDHTRRVANVETDKEWSLSSSFWNPPLDVIDVGAYPVNINPLFQLCLLHPDTFFSGLSTASHEYGLSLNEVGLFLDIFQSPNADIYSSRPDDKQQKATADGEVIGPILLYRHGGPFADRYGLICILCAYIGGFIVAVIGAVCLGWCGVG
jgi:hypothetical protein